MPTDKSSAPVVVGETAGTTEGLAGTVETKDSSVSAPFSLAEAQRSAQSVAPHVTEEYAKTFRLSKEMLTGIGNGTYPPPPAIGPIYTGDLYLTSGGWVHTLPGVAPGESTAISR